MEDLLDPDPLDTLVAQPPQVAGRVGEAVGMIDPQPVDQPVADELENAAVGGLEDQVVLLADRREVVDVEEPPVAAADRVEVEEARAKFGVRPPAVLLADAHVVGDDVQDDAESTRDGEGGELLLAAQLVAQRVGSTTS